MMRRTSEALEEMLGLEMPTGEGVRSNDLFTSGLVVPTKRHVVYRTDADDGSNLPTVIIPEAGDLDDFFATVSTYYPDLVPLSAVVHVLGKDAGHLVQKVRTDQGQRIWTQPRLRRACIGAAVGEAMLAGHSANEGSRPPSYAASRRTLAFCLARASLLHGQVLRPDAIAGRWSRLRELTGLGVIPEAKDAVLFMHSLFGDVGSTQKLNVAVGQLADSIRKLAVEQDQGSEGLLTLLGEMYPRLKPGISGLRGPFDGRLGVFSRLVEAIQENSQGIRTDEIAVAVLCDRILPGSFAHTPVLAHLVKFFPAALVWYGFFAVLSRSAETPQLAPGLLAKLDRDLLEDFSFEQRPRCDIAIEEFEVISRAALRAEAIRPTHQRALLVSLAPGVDVYTRFGTESDPAAERQRSDAKTRDLHGHVAHLLEEALYSIKKFERGGRNVESTKVGERRLRKDR